MLFFERIGATREIYYYEVNPLYKLTKNKPITYEHFAEFLEGAKERKTNENAWIVRVENVKEYDISAKNPTKQEVIVHKSPLELVESIKENSAEVSTLLDEIEAIITAREES